VVVAAHATLFHQLPYNNPAGSAVVVTDESWWQNGIDPAWDVLIAGFADSIMQAPVLRDPGYGPKDAAKRQKRDAPSKQATDEMASSELHGLATKAERDSPVLAHGALVSRAVVEAAGLTAASSHIVRAGVPGGLVRMW
jgi:hypothetical protein